MHTCTHAHAYMYDNVILLAGLLLGCQSASEPSISLNMSSMILHIVVYEALPWLAKIKAWKPDVEKAKLALSGSSLLQTPVLFMICFKVPPVHFDARTNLMWTLRGYAHANAAVCGALSGERFKRKRVL